MYIPVCFQNESFKWQWMELLQVSNQIPTIIKILNDFNENDNMKENYEKIKYRKTCFKTLLQYEELSHTKRKAGTKKGKRSNLFNETNKQIINDSYYQKYLNEILTNFTCFMVTIILQINYN